MTAAAKTHDAGYSAFAARMLAAEAAEVESIAKLNANMTKHAGSISEANSAATVRPSK